MTRIPPLEVVQSWPTPNYAHPVSRGSWLITVEVVLFIITALVVSLRLYTRGWVIKSFGIDDWLIIPASLLGLGLTIATCLATVYGYGIHVWDIRPEKRSITLQFAFANMLLFTLTVTITKLSILFFYLRLGTSKTFRNLVYGCMALVVGWGFVYVLVNIFYCVPVAAYWDITLSQNKCISEGGSLISNAVSNMILDIVLIILPIPVIWNVQLPEKQRRGLIAMFALGFLVCIAGIMRLVYVIQTVKSYDGTWDGFMCWVWVAIECDIGILTACIPSLKPLLSKLNSSVRATSVYNSSRKSARATRLASRATTLNTRTHLDSLWDASDEHIYKSGPGQVSTIVQGGAPTILPKDGAGLQRSGSVTLQRKNTFMDPYRKREGEKDLEEGIVTYDLGGQGKDEDSGVTMALWDVVKTTEIEVTSNVSDDESDLRKHSYEK